MSKSKAEREMIRQRIHQRRGDYERERHKKYLHLKHTGEYGAYYLRKQGINIKGKIKGNIRGMRRIVVQGPVTKPEPGKEIEKRPRMFVKEEIKPEIQKVEVQKKQGFISKIGSFFKKLFK